MKKTLLTISVPDLNQIDKAAKEFLHLCKNHFFFGFYGELGSGKTTFIKTICKELGSSDNITSPTFSIVNEYHIQQKSGKPRLIYHMDFYRLKNLDEALHIGVEEYFHNQDAYCFVEWPELVESLLPEKTVKVRIERIKDNSRTVRIELCLQNSK